MEQYPVDQKYLHQIFEHIQDGIIVMDQNREILLMNPAAGRLTGWMVGEHVPFCSYCKERKTAEGENRCYLIARNEVPYFLSQMPVYHGKKLDVEMSTALIYQDQERQDKEYLLVLRDQTLRQKEEEVRISKMMIKRLIEAQEKEHKRLAHELHDGVSQSLYTISVALQAIESTITEDQRLHDYVNEVRAELQRAMSDIKAYSHQLRPTSLDGLGLIPALETLRQTVQATSGLAIDLKTNVSGRLPSAVEINVYRVIQEALHNVVKYAEAQNVYLLIMKKGERLLIEVHDDGKGFELEKAKGGLGLEHMRERIEQLNGHFYIESAPGEGTTIIAKMIIDESGAEIDESHGSR
ncbi:PAS domain-containing sensor histidine kinase [Bacillus badius]|uniref:Sensor histidine kinase n=1 Tax=Bacillus badius TaxID=1455 RepID=A0ABR5AV08_BACBA|nr:PAS domain-containing sensor histidine kinase [Bacillus badius]KIL76445.1 Two component sensor histidine kinase [Bacillus badius]KIL78562.1 Two component sensor histidine kinase [Bacillus badius]KZR58678.1 ATPase [Bacillus badius]MED4715982.1 PAS domain-containing sensor histidine kinase [Bacillus badius]